MKLSDMGVEIEKLLGIAYVERQKMVDLYDQSSDCDYHDLACQWTTIKHGLQRALDAVSGSHDGDFYDF